MTLSDVMRFFVLGFFALVSMSISADEATSVGSDSVEETFQKIPGLVQAQIDAHKMPGAVVLIGDQDRVEYAAAIGNRALMPEPEAMTRDTLFDLASLTKVIATTTAVLQLVEKNKIALDSPVKRYWRRFGGNGKEHITVRQLLAHTSGLRADLNLQTNWSGRNKALELIEAEHPVATPGAGVLYSDINFEVLGELVQRVSGLTLERYCQRHIFAPLNMRDTGFRLTIPELSRVAPTAVRIGKPTDNIVHDPTAYRMGGIAGHAGLFSTADDLGRFARAILNGGALDGQRILRADTVAAMLVPQSPLLPSGWRGLGWKLEAPMVADREALPPLGAISHTGYTGTAIWIDPVSQRFMIILSNRVYPDGKGDAIPLRAQLLSLIAAEHAPLKASDIAVSQPQLAPYTAVFLATHPLPPAVMTGIDVLEKENFSALAGMRVGLITNQTGVDSAGRRTIDILQQTSTLHLKLLFSPEHGLYGNREGKIDSGIDQLSGLPVYSLYGATKRPDPAALEELDALVFDIQDAGARFYTYSTTMAYAMEASARRGIPFYVLDRPNPTRADHPAGPLLDEDLHSFAGYFRLPVQHGMTLGELAQLYNIENGINADLRVIRMRGYRRTMWYDQTGLNWVPPSPNLRTVPQVTLYSGVALLEGANLSVGRGTDQPFELVGAPWIDKLQLADYLNGRNIAGVHFQATTFLPQKDHYAGILCNGIRIILDDRQLLDAPELGVELMSALYNLYPQQFELAKTSGMTGSRSVLDAIRNHISPETIATQWQSDINQFKLLRAKYLIY